MAGHALVRRVIYDFRHLPAVAGWSKAMTYDKLRGYSTGESIAADGEGGKIKGTKIDEWYTLPPFNISVDGAALGKAIAHRDNITSTPITAIKWVIRCCPQLPRSLVQKLFRLRQVRRESSNIQMQNPKLKRVAPKDCLELGDRVCLPISVKKNLLFEAPDLVYNEGEMKFMRSLELYKDSAVIVINKPPGLPVQGGIGIKKSIDQLAAKYLKYEYQNGPRLVHRLDRDCSGVLVMGRTSLTASVLHSIFREKTSALSNGDLNHKKQVMRKKYWALVIGSPRRAKGLISVPLGKVIVGDGRSELITIRDNIDSPGAQHAVTEYRVIGSSNHGFTWLELSPLTGRKHQLRVHCAEVLGTPIVGDFKYGWQAHRNSKHPSCIARIESQQEKSSKPVMDPFDLDLESGSLSDKQWRLHLHCKEMVLPNICSTLQHAKVISDCSLEELKFDAPLPSHMQKTKAMGHHVTVFSSSGKKKQEPLDDLGADVFVVTSDTAQMLESANSLDYILDTMPVVHSLDDYLNILKADGKLIVMGLINAPFHFLSVPLFLKRLSIVGSFLGSIKEMEELLMFCQEKRLASEIEVVKLDEVNIAIERLQKNDVRYRFVVDVAGSNLDF